MSSRVVLCGLKELSPATSSCSNVVVLTFSSNSNWCWRVELSFGIFESGHCCMGRLSQVGPFHPIDDNSLGAWFPSSDQFSCIVFCRYVISFSILISFNLFVTKGDNGFSVCN